MDKKFKQGDIVRSTTTTVLVTGPGNKEVGYPCFAGVLLKESEEEPFWYPGWYSDTWTTKVFKKTKLKIEKLIP